MSGEHGLFCIAGDLRLNVALAFVAVRIMALWSGNRWIGVMLFVLGLINPATLAIVRSSNRAATYTL